MKPIGFLTAALSPIVIATVALALLKRAGIANPKLVTVIVAAALACTIGNTILIIMSQTKH